MALQLTLTDPSTGVITTNAYGRLDNIHLVVDSNGSPGTAKLSWYYNATIAADTTKIPIKTDSIVLDETQLSLTNPPFVSQMIIQLQSGALKSPMDALKTALYIVLMQSPTYSSATAV